MNRKMSPSIPLSCTTERRSPPPLVARADGQTRLYQLSMSFEIGGKVSDTAETKFGIREITSTLNENGKRVFSINGKNILIRGGGWSPDMMLRENSQRLRDEFRIRSRHGVEYDSSGRQA